MELVDIPENRLPSNGSVISLDLSGVRLRVARWMPAGECAGTVVICPGRGEFIEKYAEVVADLIARRQVVVVIDWRGQGGSSRLLADARKGHVRSFDEYRADLQGVIDATLPHCPRPYLALAHSMGGAIVLDHASSREPAFDRIVLSAPMLSIFGLRAPNAARRLAASVTRLGGGGAYVPGGSGRSWMSQPFAGNGLTSDPHRFAAFGALAAAAPHLVIGAPTYGWLHAAFRVMARLDDRRLLQRITIPVLAVTCGADRVVGTPTTERLVAQIRGGSTVTVPESLHEILMETDRFRAQFWTAFDAFVATPGCPALREQSSASNG